MIKNKLKILFYFFDKRAGFSQINGLKSREIITTLNTFVTVLVVSNWWEVTKIFGIFETTILLSALVTFAMSINTANNRFLMYKYLVTCSYFMFVLSTIFIVSSTTTITFLYIYEFFLLISAALLFLLSPNKRGAKTTAFFLLWTQLGSLLLLVGILLSYRTGGVFNFFSLNNSKLGVVTSLAILVGFLIKIPTWPFFFWLTKTHVEAPTSFSIFLSGFLVKTALFGIYRFLPYLDEIALTLATVISLLTVTISSTLFIYQTDFKKLIAYATIQEMSLLLLFLLVGQYFGIKTLAIFTITHSALSGIYFTLNDIVYRKKSTRTIGNLTGLAVTSPKLGLIWLTALVLFKGLPYTSKYLAEFNLYSTTLGYDIYLLMWVLLWATIIGNMYFSINNVRMYFGSPQTFEKINDVSFKELRSLLLPITLIVTLPILY